MKLESKITLVTCGLLLAVALLVGSTSIYTIHHQGQREINSLRVTEFEKIKSHLKDIVEVAFGLAESYHGLSQDDQYVLETILKKKLADTTLAALSEDELLSAYGEEARQMILEEGLTMLSQLRFEEGNGYFWVTDNTMPYPTMLMHAAKPDLAGKVMKGKQYHVEKYKGINIYQARAQTCNAKGEAFIEYVIEKPETGEVEEKISYSHLYKPLGWVISSGVYTDKVTKMVAQKEEEINQLTLQLLLYMAIFTGILCIIGFIVTYRFSNNLTQAITHVKDRLKSLALGHKVALITHHRKDEIGEMTQSLNSLVLGFDTYIAFAKEIGQGNLNYPFEPLSEEDILGNELLQMRTNLQKTTEEDRKRNWSTEGMAMFGDILRKHQGTIQSLCDEVLKTLAHYLNINQGAIYITEESEEQVQLKLISIYAYQRKKHMEQVISVGEGLVGQCYLEKETTLMYEIPESYVKITSGLGKATPTNIALIPMKYNDAICGVLEMASFRQWEPHELEFVEKLCESMGATVSAVKVNETTRYLLEQAQQMTEELKAQEEELRQNQEEMQASQEEMIRNQKELEEQNEALRQELISLQSTTGHANG